MKLELVRRHGPWAHAFAEESARIRDALGDAAVELHHIGSTAVPGLPAKPIVDILLGLARLELTKREVGAMRALGYEDRARRSLVGGWRAANLAHGSRRSPRRGLVTLGAAHPPAWDRDRPAART